MTFLSQNVSFEKYASSYQDYTATQRPQDYLEV